MKGPLKKSSLKSPTCGVPEGDLGQTSKTVKAEKQEGNGGREASKNSQAGSGDYTTKRKSRLDSFSSWTGEYTRESWPGELLTDGSCADSRTSLTLREKKPHKADCIKDNFSKVLRSEYGTMRGESVSALGSGARAQNDARRGLGRVSGKGRTERGEARRGNCSARIGSGDLLFSYVRVRRRGRASDRSGHRLQES